MKGIIAAFATILVMAFFAGTISAQDIEFKKSDQWEFMYEIDGVNFYYKATECHDESQGYHREYVLLKLENTNDYSVVVDYDVEMYFHNECFNCGDKLNSEHHRTAYIEGNSTIEGTCTIGEDKTLKIFSRFLNYDNPKATLTNFKLINKQITKK
ncbi:MAG: hypothetical protein C0592_01140 [Marinilabiliales bacterium]|nr:MAG: hypothetical protein C0592_01140 [Marinilabiliales bacterium]